MSDTSAVEPVTSNLIDNVCNDPSTSKLNQYFNDRKKYALSLCRKRSRPSLQQKRRSAMDNLSNNIYEKEQDKFHDCVSLIPELQGSERHFDRLITKDDMSLSYRINSKMQDETRILSSSSVTFSSSLCAGISSDKSEEGSSIPSQISKAHSDTNNADAKAKQAEMKYNHLSKSIKNVEKEMKKEEKSGEKLAIKKTKISEKVDALNSSLGKMEYSKDDFNSFEDKKISLENSVSTLQETVDMLTAQLQGRLTFEFSDPVRGFDRNKVKGIVAKLINVNKPEHATALEVVAGGKLYQVVVDEAVTGKALLNRGKLKRRVTIIPLDKITSRRITGNVVSQAQSIAQNLGTTASAAIELVGFDEEVRNAIEYVFGSTLVVDGMDAANKICDRTKTRTVTLEGDVFDPSGTISGGSRNNLGSTLSKLSELTLKSSELNDKNGQLRTIHNKIESMKLISKKFEKLSDELELANVELESIEKHISQTKFGMLTEKFTTMKSEIEEARKEAESMKNVKELKWKLYKDLKEKELELTQQRESRLKQFDE